MALIFPTNKCDLRCTHCMREEYGGTSLDLSILESFLRDLASLGGNKRHSITGGEPTVYPDLNRFFHVFRKLGMTAGMVTNGQNIQAVKEVISNKDVVTTVSISIDGASSETNDSVRGKGSFERVLEAIKMYKMGGIEVKLHTVLHSGNIHDVTDMFKLADHYGAQELNFSTLHPVKKGEENGLFVNRDELEDVRVLRRKEDKKYPNIKSGITLRHMHPYTEPEWKEEWCQPLRGKIENGIALLPNGKVSLCCDLVNIDFCSTRYNGENDRLNHILGDYTKDSMETILNNKKLLTQELRNRRRHDALSGKLVGPRQYICENCKFYFNH